MDTKVIPGYQIKKKIGAGAMASVFLAKELKLDRFVALKVMSKRLLTDPSFADRFLREARIVASISHRNIVTVFDVGSVGDYHYMAMELLPGGNLSEKIQSGLSLDDSLSYVDDIAHGLHYAASKGFIHRDIKPDNIMFGEDGRAVITDFGIARSTKSEDSMTIAGSVIGTPQYMSPEQAGGKPLDHRSDLYSLGIILYELLTGSPPFKGDSAISTGVMHITKPVPPLPQKHSKFQHFIDRALAKDCEVRYQSGQEFIDALNETIGDKASKISSANFTTISSVAESFDPDFFATTDTDNVEDEFSELLSEEFRGIDTQTRAAEKVTKNEDSSTSSVRSSSNKVPKPSSTNKTGKRAPSFLIDSDELELINDADIPTVTMVPEASLHSGAKQKKRFTPPKVLIILLTLLITLLAGHIFYVNVLGRNINFFAGAKSISGVIFEATNKEVDLITPASALDAFSKGFGKLIDDLFTGGSENDVDTTSLSDEQKKLLNLIASSIEDNKLYSPKFDCAELYYNQLKESSNNTEVEKVLLSLKSKQIIEKTLKLALDNAHENNSDAAEELINNSMGLLANINDQLLLTKHKQVLSTIKIMR